MRKYTNIIISIMMVLFIGLLASLVISANKNADAAVTNTAIAYLATTTSSVSVGPATTTSIFVVKYNCANRVISTKGQGIMIGFQSSSTQNVGFWQAASTTVSYPSNQYGCGAWNAFGLVASTSITIAEFLY